MWKDNLIFQIMNKMEKPHVFGVGFIVIHWIIGYGLPGYQFKTLAYPALGAITALFGAGVYLRAFDLDEVASRLFLAAGAIYVVTLLAAGWASPGVF